MQKIQNMATLYLRKMEINPFTDEYFMKEALKEAEKAMYIDEVPVGP